MKGKAQSARAVRLWPLRLMAEAARKMSAAQARDSLRAKPANKRNLLIGQCLSEAVRPDHREDGAAGGHCRVALEASQRQEAAVGRPARRHVEARRGSR